MAKKKQGLSAPSSAAETFETALVIEASVDTPVTKEAAVEDGIFIFMFSKK